MSRSLFLKLLLRTYNLLPITRALKGLPRVTLILKIIRETENMSELHTESKPLQYQRVQWWVETQPIKTAESGLSSDEYFG